jgi:Putative viral replication protein
MVEMVNWGGNTKTPQTSSEMDSESNGVKVQKSCLKKARFNASKYWCMTWHDYPEDWQSFLERSKPDVTFFIMGKEICPTTGRKHLQGYVETKNMMRPTALGWPKKIHWEKACGSRSANIAYCTKEGAWTASRLLDTLEECSVVEPLWLISELKPWQAKLVDIVKQVPDRRSIHWLWESVGNVGKSALAKLMCATMGAIICAGKASDMKHQIAEAVKAGRPPKIIIIDIPRTAIGYISYTGIEEIKNGCFASSKYESGMVIMNCPHVICFANSEPFLEAVSLDRWVITEIKPERPPGPLELAFKASSPSS